MKIAIVGCGQIFQTVYTHALSVQDGIEISWLIDNNPENLNKASKMYPESKKGTTIEEIKDVDAVIIATPNAFHYQQARYCLEKGWNVLVEKPLAIKYVDGLELVSLSKKLDLACCINVNRRFLPNIGMLRSVIEEQSFGKPKRIKVNDGARCIGTANGGVSYQSSLELSGGGVLYDTGSHMMDLPLYLLSADSVEKIDYNDDGHTGLEAECTFSMQVVSKHGTATVDGFFSRISPSPQKVIVEFEDAVVTTTLNPVSNLFVDFFDKPKLKFEIPVTISANVIFESFGNSLNAFLKWCKDKKKVALSSGESFLITLKTMESCYIQRKEILYPWNKLTAGMPYIHSVQSSSKKIIGIIGAGGFLGSRLFETLLKSDAYLPKPIVHSSSGAFSVLRYTNDVSIGDASDERFLKDALKECDMVVNCAINTKGSRKFAINATRKIARTVARTCAQVGVRRLVHISTLAVHGLFLGRKGDKLVFDPVKSTYASAKYLSDQDVQDECKKNGVDSVILRMGHIYGPYSAGWTAYQRDLVNKGGLISIDKWQNPSNTVFIDNAINAIVTAMNHSGVNHEIFYITDWPNKSWAEFYESLFKYEGRNIAEVPDMKYDDFTRLLMEYRKSIFAQSLDLTSNMVSYTMSKEHLKSIKANPKYQKIFDVIETIVPAKVFESIKSHIKGKSSGSGDIANVSSLIDFLCCYASSIVLPVEVAVNKLGYQPHIDKKTAATMTAQWLKLIE